MMATTSAAGLLFGLTAAGILVAVAVSGGRTGAGGHGGLSPSIPPRLEPFLTGDWAARPRTAAGEMQRQAEHRPEMERKWDQHVLAVVTDPRLRVHEIMDRLRARGFHPKIIYSWRSLATQDRLLQRRLSKVSFSFHNAVDDIGFPRALAADLVDSRYGWGDDEHGSTKTNGALAFFRALGEEAHRHGLVWGGDWSTRGSFWAPYGIGWDPAHIQAVPNGELARVREASLPALLGRGRLVRGSGGYTYRQFGNGYLQVVTGPALQGQVILPGGSPRPWQAITAEISRLT